VSRLPVVSGDAAIRVFESIGYERTRTRGSHCRLRHPNAERKPLSVPLHAELDRGLLRALIRDAGLSVEQFIEGLE
jgi:predicted RNA binding protein YcfA (HicA-like mRNA interferase family)